MSCSELRKGKRSEEEDVPTVRKDLGVVACGEEVGESFDVRNDEAVTKTLTVKDEESDGGTFVVTPRKVRLLPGKSARFRVTLTPHVPNVLHRKKCSVWSDSDIVERLEVVGTSSGPSVKPTRFCVKFFAARNGTASVRRLEMANESTCPARFRFERMGKVEPFEIRPGTGVAQARGKLIVDVRFKPSRPGVYCRRVYCLLQYHPPILIVLMGVYDPKLKIDPKNLTLQHAWKEHAGDGYEGYMRNLNENYVSDLEDPCLHVLRPTKIAFADEKAPPPTHPTPTSPSACDCPSFGSPGDEKDSVSGSDETEEEGSKSVTDSCSGVILTSYYADAGSNPSLGVTLVNMSDVEGFCFDWSNVSGKSFSVTPRSGHVKEGQTLDLTVQFSPDSPERLYGGDLDVRIFPAREVPPDVIALPATLSLSLIGHSFAAESDHWLEQCEIVPQNLFLPCCVPGEVVYATLIIKRNGHLPVTFQFISPADSCIKIKPPLGFITGAYQLFVVQFDASTKGEGEYTEVWRVAYNASTRYYGHLRITARVEEPKILFGEGNAFEFDVTLPGGMSKSSMPIHNPTRLRLRYEFFIPKHLTWADIPNRCGELEPLATSWTDVVFTPSQADEYSDYVTCTSLCDSAPKHVVSNDIELRGSCQDGFLVATPPSHDFGKCLYGTEHTERFHVFNFTPVLMHFQLIVTNDELLEDETKCTVTVTPDRGSLSGKNNVQVEVRVTPFNVERSKHSIWCQLMALAEGGDPLPRAEVRTLFTFTIEGTLPTVQVIDLNVEGGGPLFSPDWLWKMLGINRLNELLLRVRPGEEEATTLRLPEGTVNSSPVIISMLVEARNLHPMTVDIARTSCYHSCISETSFEDTPSSKSNFMTLSPTKMSLKPSCREVLKLALVYEAEGSSKYTWKVSLSENRAVCLEFTISALPIDNLAQTSIYLSQDVHFKPVFIGDLTPPVQLFWLYNNTQSPAAYVLDKMALRQSTPPFECIFSCLNSSGVLPPYSSMPLMFMFVPNELKEYKAEVQLCLSTTRSETITLTGCGVFNFSHFAEFGHERTVSEKPILAQNFIGLEPSVKVVTLDPFATFSSIGRLFFLRNTSKDKVWAFRWHSYHVENIIWASVEPSEGKLGPNEKLLLRLNVKSLRYPTNVSISIPCDVVDYTSLEAYERAVKLSEDVTERFADHFTITEKGTFNTVPRVDIPPKPEICHIFITVRTNIIAESSIETKLYPRNALKLPRGSEFIDFPPGKPSLDEVTAKIVNLTLEKLIWQILNSSSFDRQVASYCDLYGRATYLEILPEAERKTKDLQQHFFASPPKNLVQRVIRDIIADILSRRFRE